MILTKSGGEKKINFFNTAKMPCKEGDFLFSTDTENGGDMEIVVVIDATTFKTYTPTTEAMTVRPWTDWKAAKLRVGRAAERAKMTGFFLTALAFEQTRIDAKRTFFAKLSVGVVDCNPVFMTKRDFI